MCFATPLADGFKKSSDVEIKRVKIKDVNDNPVEAVIASLKPERGRMLEQAFGGDSKEFRIFVGDKLGYIEVFGTKDDNINKDRGLYVKEFYTEENNLRHYKGAGVELLKCAVEESKKRGFGGKIHLTASNVPPPFVFYYKNNFIPEECADKYFAAIDYAARKNIPISRILPKYVTNIDMKLDEKGAEAFLNNQRLFYESEL